MTEAQGVPSWGMRSPLVPPGQPKKRGRTLIIAGALVLILVAIAAASTVLVLNHRADVAAQERREAAEQKAEEERLAAEEAERQAEAEAAAALEEAQDTYDDCFAELQPLLNALSNIDSRLNVGLNQQELSNQLGRASIAYDKITIDNLGKGTCLTAAAKLETAFNQYNSTVQSWGDCIYDYYCDVDDDVLPGMQVKWASASSAINRAETLIETLDPDSPSYRSGGLGDGA